MGLVPSSKCIGLCRVVLNQTELLWAVLHKEQKNSVGLGMSRKELSVDRKDFGTSRKELCKNRKDFAWLEKKSAWAEEEFGVKIDAGKSEANTTSPKPIREGASRRRISDSVGSLKQSRQFLPNKEA